jgi:hypothetical protein
MLQTALNLHWNLNKDDCILKKAGITSGFFLSLIPQHRFITFVKKGMKPSLLLLSCLLSLSLTAQTYRTVRGQLKDSITREPIVMASVKNNVSGVTVMTNSKGLFSLPVAPGQLLSFAAVGYHFDTVFYTGTWLLKDTLQLELSSLVVTSLGNVTVSARGLSLLSRYQLDSIQRHNDFFQAAGAAPLPTLSKANSGAGIALNIDRFSKREKRKRNAISFFNENEMEAYINYRYTPELVMKYTGFKDEKLEEFMGKSRPSWEWLRKHPTEVDMSYYINEQLKKYPPAK